MLHKDKKGFFDSLNPKSAFWLGLVATLIVVFVVGFFVLLGLVLSDGDSPTTANQPTNTNNQQANNNNPQPAGSADVNLAAVSAEDWIRGDVNAPITVVEYSDLECPFCQRFHSTMQQVVEEYDGQVNWVYRHFPLASLHSKAPQEAEAAECAGELGGNDAFWDYVDRLFTITPANNGLDLAQLPSIAEYVGLDRQEFNDCLESGDMAENVNADLQDARNAGGTGTPYSVIVAGDQKIPVKGAVSFTQMKSMLDSLIE